MLRFLVQFAFTVAGFWLAQQWVPGIDTAGWPSLLIAAFLLGIANAILKPILVVVTFPITLVTFGLFLLVINAAMLGLVGAVMKGLTVDGFWPAFWGAIVIGVASWIGDKLVGEAEGKKG
ncbi:MAG TPA: phage holin family protein [Caulobacter sp.]|nr:phage holin family protein [Caulobacter sp.]